ncbi:MAG: M13 family metallopeptidase [Burkholderiales bacterium]|nr:M13 family metallopeptidase [Burkholderiales bacterium]
MKKIAWMVSVAMLAVPAMAGTDAAPAARPQDDLFQSVNGEWLRATPIPDDKGEYGSFLELRDKSDAQVRAIVEQLAATPQAKGTVAQKVADLYASYLDTNKIDKAGLAPLAPRLAQIDAIKTTQDFARWMGSVQGELETPVGFGVMSDFKNPELNMSFVFQGGLGLPDRDYYLKLDDKEFAKARTAYQDYLLTLVKLANLSKGDQVKAMAMVQRVMALETKIAEVQWSRVDNRDPAKLYNPMSIDELASKAPGLDWKAFQASAGLASQHDLVVAQPSAAVGIAKLMTEVPLADWKVYAKLHLLDDKAQMLPQAWRDANFAFHGTALTGTKAPRPRWQKSIAKLNEGLGEAVGQLYVEKNFPPENKARMVALVGNLLATYKDSIDKLSWMSDATKKQAQEKLALYTTKIGYPDTWRDYSKLNIMRGDVLGNDLRVARFEWARQVAKAGKPVDHKEWGMTPQTVNAEYNPLNNDITFPAAILQPPFFDMSRDDAYNYGAIGAVIGHEISHGFDDEGSQFDGHGKLSNWWTDEDRKAFNELGARLVAQFDGYEPLPGHHVNGKLTLGENIADLSGLQISYKAYLRSLGGKAPETINGMTAGQRFFVGWAEAWRSKERDENLLKDITSNPHAPDWIRANGAAINSDAFQAAFDLKPGDKMYKPEADRVRIW